MRNAKRLLILATIALVGSAASGAADPLEGLVTSQIPAEDPGPPFYARVTPIMNELFFTDDWLVIPFYRDPACVPPDFNLLDLYHFPSDAGPGAFACRLLVSGVAYTEPDAGPMEFPKRVTMDGSGAVEVWFVPAAPAREAIAAGALTLADLERMEPMRGLAATFHEVLQPRMDDHLIVIEARGHLEDGRSFTFDLVHQGDAIEDLAVSID